MALDKFVLALAQIDPRLGDVEANREQVARRLGEARAQGADLVIFPELALTGYFLKDQVPEVALRADGPQLAWLRELSKEIAVVIGLVEESRAFIYYNAALYLERGELVHVHRKCYLPTYGLFDELRYFGRGRRLGGFDSRFGRMALLICEDMWHPSAVYLAAADYAATMVTISASPVWGVGKGELPENAAHWRKLVRFSAETWGLFVAYCNRVGFEDGVGFWGGSELVDPFGQTVAAAPCYEEGLVLGEVDLRKTRRKRLLSTTLRDEDLQLTLSELARIARRTARAAETAELAAADGRRAAQDNGAPPASRDEVAAPRKTAAGKGTSRRGPG